MIWDDIGLAGISVKLLVRGDEIGIQLQVQQERPRPVSRADCPHRTLQIVVVPDGETNTTQRLGDRREIGPLEQ